MRDATDALVLDLVEWIAREPRLYSDVIDTWRTSCPRLTIWEDAVDRGYVAIVEGRVRDDAGTLRDRLIEDRTTLRVRTAPSGREAITEYRVRERRPRSTVLDLRLRTGRRGQMRAQLATLGHPIVGDRAFGAQTEPVRRVCLHAAVLGFTDTHGRRLRFTSPVPF